MVQTACRRKRSCIHPGVEVRPWELVEFDAPRHVVIEGNVGGGTYRWVSDFEPASEGIGTQMRGRMERSPGRALSFFSALLRPLLALSARRSFGRFAEVLGAQPA